MNTDKKPGMFDECAPLAEAIAEKQWAIHVEEEQSKTQYEIDAPEWKYLDDGHKRHLTSRAEPLAVAVWRLGWRPDRSERDAQEMRFRG